MFFRQLSTSPTTFKSFEDYIDISPMRSSQIEVGRLRFTAKQKKVDREQNEFYDDTWYLLMRQGKFGAEVEKAVSLLYQHFLGYSTDIDIIKDNDDFYVASRGIANFKSWDGLLSALKIQNNNSLVLDTGSSMKKIIGLGKLCALTEFFGDLDMGGGSNFGVQEHENMCLAVKIDNEHAFSFEKLKKSREVSDTHEVHSDNESNHGSGNGDVIMEVEIRELCNIMFKCDITQMEWFTSEKQEMLDLLAKTDFSLIEMIVRKNITSHCLESARWMWQHLLKHNDSIDKDEISAQLMSFDDMDSKSMGDVDSIVAVLKDNHEQLRIRLGCPVQEASAACVGVPHI